MDCSFLKIRLFNIEGDYYKLFKWIPYLWIINYVEVLILIGREKVDENIHKEDKIDQ
jgi:hypothetical protein